MMTLCKLLSGMLAWIARRAPKRSPRVNAPPPRFRKLAPAVGDYVRFRHMTGQWFDGVVVQQAKKNLWYVDYRNSAGGVGTTLCYGEELFIPTVAA